jgi:hypothetical protein
VKDGIIAAHHVKQTRARTGMVAQVGFPASARKLGARPGVPRRQGRVRGITPADQAVWFPSRWSFQKAQWPMTNSVVNNPSRSTEPSMKAGPKLDRNHEPRAMKIGKTPRR